MHAAQSGTSIVQQRTDVGVVQGQVLQLTTPLVKQRHLHLHELMIDNDRVSLHLECNIMNSCRQRKLVNVLVAHSVQLEVGILFSIVG